MDHTGPSKEDRGDTIPAVLAPPLPVEDVRKAPSSIPAPRRSSRMGRRLLAWLLYLIGGGFVVSIGLILVAVMMEYEGRVPGEQLHPRAMQAALLLLAALLFPLFHLVRKLTAPSAEEILAKDPRAPVLLLRSFKIDTDQVLRQWGIRVAGAMISGHPQTKSPEQAFVAELQRIGPVVAIGQPGERLPKLGAARMYVAQDQWQAKVRELSSRAALIVLGIGETDGLFWEVERVVREADPTRVLLYEPPVLKERDRIYQRFQERANKVLPKPLPAELGLARYIGFHADWTPAPLVDLGPVYHRFGVAAEAKRGCFSQFARAMFWIILIAFGLFAALFIIGLIIGGDPDPPSKVVFSRKVTAPDAMPYAWFGYAIVVSDGRMLVAAPKHGRPVEAAGAVYVFGRDNADLQRTLQPANPQPGEKFGDAIAALDGQAVIGTDSTDRPKAYLARLAGSPSQLELFNPTPPVRGSGFGRSVAIGSTRALVAAHGSGDRGTAHLFNVTDGSLIGSMDPSRLAPDARIAASVGMGKQTLFFGNNNPMGARTPRVVYAMKVEPEPKNVTHFELRPDDPAEEGFGNVLATGGDYVVVGGAEFLGTGRAYVFDVDTGERRGVFELNGASSAGFAASVATNGHLLAVGAPGFQVEGRSVGAVFVYDIKTQREIARLLPPDDAPDALFGMSVAIDGDGVVVGAPFDSSAGESAGAVYLYRFE